MVWWVNVNLLINRKLDFIFKIRKLCCSFTPRCFIFQNDLRAHREIFIRFSEICDPRKLSKTALERALRSCFLKHLDTVNIPHQTLKEILAIKLHQESHLVSSQ